MQYADYHFKNEEKVMTDVGFKNYQEHKREHKVFQKKIIKLSEDTLDKKESVPEEVMLFLREWLIDHVLHSDMELKEYLTAGRKTRITKTK